MGKGAFQVERTRWVKEERGKEVSVCKSRKCPILILYCSIGSLWGKRWRDKLGPDDQGPCIPCRGVAFIL